MIDREKVLKCLDILQTLPDDDVTIQITHKNVSLRIYPKNWYEVLALVTPLVGRLDKLEERGNIGYKGEKDGLSVNLNYVDKCKIVGYKTVTKTVKKEIEREPEYEIEEITERVAISDCDIRTGKFKETDIEVPA